MFPNSQAPLNNQVLTTLGNKTKTTILALESDRISLEFTAAAAIKPGQPVKLTAAGKVTPWAKADKLVNLIGYAYGTATADGDLITVFTRGFLVIYALSNGVDDAGASVYTSYDTTTDLGENMPKGFSKYAPIAGDGSEDAKANAFTLDQAAAAGTMVRVLMMN